MRALWVGAPLAMVALAACVSAVLVSGGGGGSQAQGGQGGHAQGGQAQGGQAQGGQGGQGGSCPAPPASLLEGGFVIAIGTAISGAATFLDATYEAASGLYVLTPLCSRDRQTPVGPATARLKLTFNPDGTFIGETVDLNGDGTSPGWIDLPSKASLQAEPVDQIPLTLRLEIGGHWCGGELLCGRFVPKDVDPPQLFLVFDGRLHPKPIDAPSLTTSNYDPDTGSCTPLAFDEPPKPCPTCTRHECDNGADADPTCLACISGECSGSGPFPHCCSAAGQSTCCQSDPACKTACDCLDG